MRKRLIKYVGTLGVILAIVIMAIISFMDLLPEEWLMRCLLCAMFTIAVDLYIASLQNDNKHCDIINKILDVETAISEMDKKIMDNNMSNKVTRKEHYKRLNCVALNAKHQIWIMTIDTALNRKIVNSIPERELYYNTIEMLAKTQKNVSIRRIYGLPDEKKAREDRIKWILSDIEKIKKCSNVHIRIFDWRKFKSMPAPLSMQIIDDDFVGLVNLQEALVGVEGGGEDLCVEDKNIVEHLKMYYENVWKKCDELKMGDEIRRDVLI